MYTCAIMFGCVHVAVHLRRSGDSFSSFYYLGSGDHLNPTHHAWKEVPLSTGVLCWHKAKLLNLKNCVSLHTIISWWYSFPYPKTASRKNKASECDSWPQLHVNHQSCTKTAQTTVKHFTGQICFKDFAPLDKKRPAHAEKNITLERVCLCRKAVPLPAPTLPLSLSPFQT